MSVISRRRIRFAADIAAKTSDPMEDIYTGDTPELWRGNDAQFEVGIFFNETLQTDISNIATITLDVKSTSDRDGDPLITATLQAADLDDTLDSETWADGTKQHALFTFTGDETNIELDGNDDDCWLIISYTTTDNPGRSITIQHTIIKIVEDGAGSDGQPQNNANLYYTKAEADGRYVQKHEDQAWVQWANGRWYYYISDTGLWYPEIAAIEDGVPVLTLGEGVASP